MPVPSLYGFLRPAGSSSSITFVTSVSNSHSGGFTVTYPGTVQAGDICIAASLFGNSGFTPPSGWSSYTFVIRNPGQVQNMCIAYKVLTSTDITAGVSPTISPGGQGAYTAVFYRGATGTLTQKQTLADQPGTTISFSGFTPSTGGVAVSFISASVTNTITATVPSGWTQRGYAAGVSFYVIYGADNLTYTNSTATWTISASGQIAAGGGMFELK